MGKAGVSSSEAATTLWARSGDETQWARWLLKPAIASAAISQAPPYPAGPWFAPMLTSRFQHSARTALLTSILAADHGHTFPARLARAGPQVKYLCTPPPQPLESTSLTSRRSSLATAASVTSPYKSVHHPTQQAFYNGCWPPSSPPRYIQHRIISHG